MIGFRKWRIDDRHLSSPYARIRWRQREMHARCHRHSFASHRADPRPLDEDHEAPHPSCNCGIYAYYEPHARPRAIYVRLAWGIVTLWGRIEAHGNGMRAEHARVEALASSPEWPNSYQRALQRVAKELEIDLVRHTELERAAGEYGGRLPASLVP